MSNVIFFYDIEINDCDLYRSYYMRNIAHTFLHCTYITVRDISMLYVT